MNKRFILLAVLLFAAAMPAFADKPAKPAGMAKFIVFLKHAPPVPPGQTPKKIVPPDVGKLGGVVLQVRDDYRVVYLPFAAAKQLRDDENVDYLQRVWMGETQEEWNATEAPAQQPASLMRLRTNTLTETATWGPKKYSYDGSGNISQIAEFDANQNVKPIGTDTYRYDAVSRLTQAVVNGVTETYAYDAFGNLTEKQTGSKSPVSMPAEMSSNRLATLTYDIAGNVTSDPGKRFGYYVYDSMGMLVATSATGGRKRMYYTADDERIGFSLDNSLSRWTIRDFEGRPLREFRAADPVSDLEDSDWIWTEDYVYAGGQLVAGETAGAFGVIGSAIQPDRRRRHFHLDHLGSVRLITADTDAAALGVHNYYPFGAEQTPLGQEALNFGGGGDIRPEPLRFTGHERDFNGSWNLDNDDYVDYMHARYYDPFAGRFLAVDPVLDAESNLRNPQGWNRYAYVEDNPINRIDPDGRVDESIDLLWSRLKHIITRHVDKSAELHKSKFTANNPKDAQKLIEKTVKTENLVRTQTNGRKVYEKTFNKVVGTKGETTVRAVTEPVAATTEKVITGYPTTNTLVGIANVAGIADTLLNIVGFQVNFKKENQRSPTMYETMRFVATGETRSDAQIWHDYFHTVY